jgi:Trk K+ transport system NAD-binding subunit
VVVDAGSPLEGRQVRDLPEEQDVWVGIVVRDGRALRVRPDTVLRAGDELLLIADPIGTSDDGEELRTNEGDDGSARA